MNKGYSNITYQKTVAFLPCASNAVKQVFILSQCDAITLNIFYQNETKLNKLLKKQYFRLIKSNFNPVKLIEILIKNVMFLTLKCCPLLVYYIDLIHLNAKML